jgi:hypothetical protein
MARHSLVGWTVCSLLTLGLALACSSSDDNGTSGTSGSGGAAGSGGGAAATGGGGGSPPSTLGPTPSYDATYCVRPPGTTYGAGDGSTWSDALSGIPEDLERGARYLIASGDYRPDGGLEFDDPPNEQRYIGIEKATAQEHGPEQGWDASMAEGPAFFDPFAVITSHYVFDGKTGSGTEGHGFVLQTTDCDAANAYTVAFPWDSESTNVVLRHMNLGHCGDLGYNGPSHDSIYSTRPLSNIWVERCYIHDANRTHMVMIGWSNVVVDGCYFARNGNQEESHTIAANGVDGLTLRGNVFEDSPSVFVVLRGTTNVAIHANLFLLTYEEGRGVYAAVDGPEDNHNVLVYGNTFFKLFGLNSGIRFQEDSTGVEVFNNLWAGCRTNQIMLTGEHDHNAFFDNWRVEGGNYNLDERIEEEHVQVLSEDPFVDAANWDLRLAEPTEAGRTLPTPYDEDLLGEQRGGDGTWDRGAYEYSEMN